MSWTLLYCDTCYDECTSIDLRIQRRSCHATDHQCHTPIRLHLHATHHRTVRYGTCGLGREFNTCFANTLTTTVRRHDDGTTFLLTGDIPAMWLRDSSAQFRPYLVIAQDDPDMADLVAGLVRQQFRFINIDPYANAFNETPSGATWDPDDRTDSFGPWLWERKYEVDSLCYPIQLAWLLYRNTGLTSHFDESFVSGVRRILDTFETEQNHAESRYRFFRPNDDPRDSVPNEGLGGPFAVTGMTWSGFRPSDDACIYPYLVPSNMFAVVAMGHLRQIFTDVLDDAEIVRRAGKLQHDISDGIAQHATIRNAAGERIYAYETDGLGNALLMDDSQRTQSHLGPIPGILRCRRPVVSGNPPHLAQLRESLLFRRTLRPRHRFPHTPTGYVWPIAMAMQGLTSNDRAEKERLLDQLVAADAGTHLMHESFDVSDPTQYTRPWFSWANMMFCELVMDFFGIRINT